MKINMDSPSEEVRIEIIPLIDVIFCILTFFILAAVGLTRQQAINVDLPAASTGTPQMREMLIVSIDPIGQPYIEQEPVTEDQLYQVLQEYEQQSPDGLMVLYASRLASYDDVVRVLDLLRSVGGDRVALATLPDSSAQPGQITPGLDPNAPPGSLSPIPGQPGPGQPGTDSFGVPGSTTPLTPEQLELFPELQQPNPAQPGGVQPGSVQPGDVQPGAVQPNGASGSTKP